MLKLIVEKTYLLTWHSIYCVAGHSRYREYDRMPDAAADAVLCESYQQIGDYYG